MKKYLLILPAAILLTGTVYFLAPGNNNSRKPDLIVKNTDAGNEVTKPNDDDCCKAITITEGGYTDMSVYLSNGKWADQNGNKADLGKFKNKNVVLAMFFASCQSACPVIVNDMKIIEKTIPENKINNYRFVLVSIDPERDTPRVLKNYARDHNLKSPNWTLLTGSKNDIMELAMMLGFKYSKNSSGGFTHTNLISFLNDKGEIIFQNDGLVVDMGSVSKTISKLN
ncbi:MAG TPA: SCO family protein [Ignavibacteriaceae bacterium]|nr:SCO family protein [Ignavibacteriaceae bacterium]